MPLFSIVTATYNSEKYLSDSIKSVLNQSLKDWELLITDDCSSDNSLSIANNYAKDNPKIKVFKLEKNSGAAVARNHSIKHAEGDYLAFLDSDDLWLSNKLEMQFEQIKLNQNCALFYSAYNYINSQGDFIRIQEVPEKIYYKDLLKSCHIGCLTAIVNTKVTGKIYMPLIRKRQDFAFWLKILKKHDCAIGINKPLAQYRTGNPSISSNKLKVSKYQWQTYYKLEKLGMIKSLYYMINWAFRGFIKHYWK